jgi:eukaryotic-like serine/threonine-protein kinase
VTDTLAAVVRAEPDWSELPAATPARVRVLLKRCLQKDPKQRLRDIGDARISLDEVLSSPPELPTIATTPISVPLWRRALPWALLGTAVIALIVLGLAYLRMANAPIPTAAAARFQIPLTERQAPGGGRFALSPDGRQLAFAAIGTDGVPRLWVRSLDSLGARPLPGSESPEFAPFFWSPDGKYIAFGSGGQLEKIDISGGPAQTICDVAAVVVGGSWNRDGVIIFGTSNGGLRRVSAGGGAATPLTTLDSSRKEIDHALPSFLPDGRHFIYLRQSAIPEDDGVYVGSLDAKPEEQDLKRLVATDWGPAYVPRSAFGMGQLLFLRAGTLMAQPFDDRRLELSGEPVAVAEHVGNFINGGFFSVSAADTLVYMTGSGTGASQLTWIDREGKVVGTAGQPSPYYTLALSPDGKRAAVTEYASPGANLGLWVLDLSRGTSTRFTFGPSFDLDPVWSPDGGRIVFQSNRNGVYDIYQKLASGAKDEELLLEPGEAKLPRSWSRDGRFLLYELSDAKTKKTDLWVLPLGGDKKPFPFLQADFNNLEGLFSPDGRFVAYVSDESGRNEIYVRTFSAEAAAATLDAGGKWLVSTGGGVEPRWSRDGKELYYLAPEGKVMNVEIATNPEFRAGVPKALFQTPPSAISTSDSSWDLTPDGKRFLFAVPTEQGAAPFTVVLNWRAGLKK